MKIKNRWTGEVIIEDMSERMVDLVVKAVKSRADLYGADLSCADLSCADLSCANLYGADLSCANLSRANLSCADLSCADLSCANLYGADLSRANLHGADLHGADLYGADLSRANLSRANLYGANLSRANLYGADLSCANLHGADLHGADLSRANLHGANLLKKYFWIVPEEGAFIAYKKVYESGTNKPVILTLQIPNTARRTACLKNRKCRASAAVPIKAEFLDGSPCNTMTFTNMHSKYPVIWGMGVKKYALWFDDDIREDCRPGIHFFVTKQEAREFQI